MSDAQEPADERGTSGEIPAEPPREDPPRLRPRGLDRPAVDPESAAVFGRPTGVPGAFADRGAAGGSGRPVRARSTRAPAPTAALASAFGRPAADAPTLQRPPGAGTERPPDDDAFWPTGDAAGTDGRDDPWRRPESPVELGPPPGATPSRRASGDPGPGSASARCSSAAVSRRGRS
jgi:hypothetical protein